MSAAKSFAGRSNRRSPGIGITSSGVVLSAEVRLRASRAHRWWTSGLVVAHRVMNYGSTQPWPQHSAWTRRQFALMLCCGILLMCAGMLVPIRTFDAADVLLALGTTAVPARRRMASSIDRDEPAPVRARGRPTLLVYGVGFNALEIRRELKGNLGLGRIGGFIRGANETEVCVPAEEVITHDRPLKQIAKDIGADEVVVSLVERRGGSMPLRELLDCRIAGLPVRDLNSYFENRLGQIRLDNLKASWLIFGNGFEQGILRSVLKRSFDMMAAVLLLVITLPVMALAAAAIRIESRGPVLYRQERTGFNGEPFYVIKFRSMRVDAESDGKPRWATAGDSRITRVGRIIRKTRIDELPQLWCVLRGTMSLVGPRPERPFFVAQLTQDIPFYAVRHCVKPGVTGWAQVRADYGSTIEETCTKLQYDLYYVKNHSLWLDLRIMLETVVVVLTGRGAR